MGKIELTAVEIEMVEKQLSGEIEVWSATDEQQQILKGVISKAEDLIDKLDAYDELEKYPQGGLIEWFYNQYKLQLN